MKCTNCKAPGAKVIDSRQLENSRRRRYECIKCGFRFSTLEHTEAGWEKASACVEAVKKLKQAIQENGL